MQAIEEKSILQNLLHRNKVINNVSKQSFIQRLVS